MTFRKRICGINFTYSGKDDRCCTFLYRLTPLKDKRREQSVVFEGYNTYQPSRSSYLPTLSSMTQIAITGKLITHEEIVIEHK